MYFASRLGCRAAMYKLCQVTKSGLDPFRLRPVQPGVAVMPDQQACGCACNLKDRHGTCYLLGLKDHP